MSRKQKPAVTPFVPGDRVLHCALGRGTVDYGAGLDAARVYSVVFSNGASRWVAHSTLVRVKR